MVQVHKRIDVWTCFANYANDLVQYLISHCSNGQLLIIVVMTRNKILFVIILVIDLSSILFYIILIRTKNASYSSMNLNVWEKTVSEGRKGKEVKEVEDLIVENEEIIENDEIFSEVRNDETWIEESFLFWGLSNPLSFTISHTHTHWLTDWLTDRQLSFSKRACVPPLFFVSIFKFVHEEHWSISELHNCII
jgi:hypothetical protein